MKIFFIIAVLISASTAQSVGLRERLKNRWIEKQQEKPAPAASGSVNEKIVKPGDYTFPIEVSGVTRFYKIHVPPKYDGQTATPLIFVLHGGGGDMSIQSDDRIYKQITKADEKGFVAVFPNGYSKLQSGKLATWNAGKCCGDARENKIDDILFIKKSLEQVSSQLNIDAKRVYATGMSNGGMMAYRIACELPESFTAIAAVAGTDNTVECSPKKAIPILHIHAKDDDHVLFEGGAGKNAFRDLSKVTEFTSVPATVAKWVKINACGSTPKRIVEKPGAYCDRYENCRDKSAVQLCVTDKGGHSWPGGKKARAFSGVTPSSAISANDVMWEFFDSLPVK